MSEPTTRTTRAAVVSNEPWLFGLQFTMGATAAVVMLAICANVITWGADRLGWSGHDSTDAPGAHSGLTAFTDHLTGCQYLGSSNGLAPRLGADGKQVCLVREPATT